MKFFIIIIFETALNIAVQKENLKIVNILLSSEKININAKSVLIEVFLYNLHSLYFTKFRK